MPDAKFLETYPLYRKFRIEIGYSLLKDIELKSVWLVVFTANLFL